MQTQTLYHVVRDFVYAGLLVAILFRQEKIMSDLDTLNSEVAEVTADEASVKADIAKVIAPEPDLSGAIAALQTLHGSLQSDDAALEGAEGTPASPPADSGTAASNS